MSFLVTSPMAVYQLTRLQQEIVKPLKTQQDLYYGYKASPTSQNNRHWEERYETYINWCKTNSCEVGTKAPPLSTMKVQAIIASFYAINLIKHPLGCIESIARIPFSTLTFIAEAIVDAPLINRAFSIQTSLKLKEFNCHLGNPFSNTAHSIYEFFFSFVYGFGTINHRIGSNFSHVYEQGNSELERHCQHELQEMTGDKLWQIYATRSNPNLRKNY